MRRVPGPEFSPAQLPAGRVPVLFWAEWCGYCHRFFPAFEKVEGGVAVDVSDDDHPIWERYRIHVVPTVILFEDGRPTEKRWAGPLREEHAREMRALQKA